MPIIRSCDGVLIHFEIRGTGPANLVFLHGWGGSGETWIETVQHLDAARCRAICLDLRGHGKSGVPAATHTIQNFAGDVLAVADAAGAKTFIPVGFSMGGKLACHLAANHPVRVAAMVLAAPAASKTPLASPAMRMKVFGFIPNFVGDDVRSLKL